MYPKTQSLTDN